MNNVETPLLKELRRVTGKESFREIVGEVKFLDQPTLSRINSGKRKITARWRKRFVNLGVSEEAINQTIAANSSVKSEVERLSVDFLKEIVVAMERLEIKEVSPITVNLIAEHCEQIEFHNQELVVGLMQGLIRG